MFLLDLFGDVSVVGFLYRWEYKLMICYLVSEMHFLAIANSALNVFLAYSDSFNFRFAYLSSSYLNISLFFIWSNNVAWFSLLILNLVTSASNFSFLVLYSMYFLLISYALLLSVTIAAYFYRSWVISCTYALFLSANLFNYSFSFLWASVYFLLVIMFFIYVSFVFCCWVCASCCLASSAFLAASYLFWFYLCDAIVCKILLFYVITYFLFFYASHSMLLNAF